MAAMNLVVHNDGQMPTFQRRSTFSFIDVTFSTRRVGRDIGEWRVLEGETLSDHRYITFCIRQRRKIPRSTNVDRQIQNIDSTMLLRKLTTVWEEHRSGTTEITAEECTRNLREAQALSTTRRGRDSGKVPYWWTNEIELAKQRCVTKRRRALRASRRGNLDEVSGDNYKEPKRELYTFYRRLINNSKRNQWRELCARLDEDI